MEEIEKDEDTYEVIEEIPNTVPGIAGVLQILASKVSRKAAIVALAMVLVYLLAVTPTVQEVVFITCVITGLAVFFTILQWILDKKKTKVKLKILERTSKKE